MRFLLGAAAALALLASQAQAQSPSTAHDASRSQQNAVSNQQSTDQLGVAAPTSLRPTRKGGKARTNPPAPPASRHRAMAARVAAPAHNATNAEQNTSTVMQASTTQGASLGYGVDTSSTAVGIAEILAGKDGAPNTPAAPKR